MTDEHGLVENLSPVCSNTDNIESVVTTNGNSSVTSVKTFTATSNCADILNGNLVNDDGCLGASCVSYGNVEIIDKLMAANQNDVTVAPAVVADAPPQASESVPVTLADETKICDRQIKENELPRLCTQPLDSCESAAVFAYPNPSTGIDLAEYIDLDSNSSLLQMSAADDDDSAIELNSLTPTLPLLEHILTTDESPVLRQCCEQSITWSETDNILLPVEEHSSVTTVSENTCQNITEFSEFPCQVSSKPVDITDEQDGLVSSCTEEYLQSDLGVTDTSLNVCKTAHVPPYASVSMAEASLDVVLCEEVCDDVASAEISSVELQEEESASSPVLHRGESFSIMKDALHNQDFEASTLAEQTEQYVEDSGRDHSSLEAIVESDSAIVLTDELFLPSAAATEVVEDRPHDSSIVEAADDIVLREEVCTSVQLENMPSSSENEDILSEVTFDGMVTASFELSTTVQEPVELIASHTEENEQQLQPSVESSVMAFMQDEQSSQSLCCNTATESLQAVEDVNSIALCEEVSLALSADLLQHGENVLTEMVCDDKPSSSSEELDSASCVVPACEQEELSAFAEEIVQHTDSEVTDSLHKPNVENATIVPDAEPSYSAHNMNSVEISKSDSFQTEESVETIALCEEVYDGTTSTDDFSFAVGRESPNGSLIKSSRYEDESNSVVKDDVLLETVASSDSVADSTSAAELNSCGGIGEESTGIDANGCDLFQTVETVNSIGLCEEVCDGVVSATTSSEDMHEAETAPTEMISNDDSCLGAGEDSTGIDANGCDLFQTVETVDSIGLCEEVCDVVASVTTSSEDMQEVETVPTEVFANDNSCSEALQLTTDFITDSPAVCSTDVVAEDNNDNCMPQSSECVTATEINKSTPDISIEPLESVQSADELLLTCEEESTNGDVVSSNWCTEEMLVEETVVSAANEQTSAADTVEKQDIQTVPAVTACASADSVQLDESDRISYDVVLLSDDDSSDNCTESRNPVSAGNRELRDEQQPFIIEEVSLDSSDSNSSSEPFCLTDAPGTKDTVKLDALNTFGIGAVPNVNFISKLDTVVAVEVSAMSEPLLNEDIAAEYEETGVHTETQASEICIVSGETSNIDTSTTDVAHAPLSVISDVSDANTCANADETEVLSSHSFAFGCDVLTDNSAENGRTEDISEQSPMDCNMPISTDIANAQGTDDISSADVCDVGNSNKEHTSSSMQGSPAVVCDVGRSALADSNESEETTMQFSPLVHDVPKDATKQKGADAASSPQSGDIQSTSASVGAAESEDVNSPSFSVVFAEDYSDNSVDASEDACEVMNDEPSLNSSSSDNNVAQQQSTAALRQTPSSDSVSAVVETSMQADTVLSRSVATSVCPSSVIVVKTSLTGPTLSANGDSSSVASQRSNLITIAAKPFSVAPQPEKIPTIDDAPSSTAPSSCRPLASVVLNVGKNLVTQFVFSEIVSNKEKWQHADTEEKQKIARIKVAHWHIASRNSVYEHNGGHACRCGYLAVSLTELDKHRQSGYTKSGCSTSVYSPLIWCCHCDSDTGFSLKDFAAHMRYVHNTTARFLLPASRQCPYCDADTNNVRHILSCRTLFRLNYNLVYPIDKHDIPLHGVRAQRVRQTVQSATLSKPTVVVGNSARSLHLPCTVSTTSSVGGAPAVPVMLMARPSVTTNLINSARFPLASPGVTPVNALGRGSPSLRTYRVPITGAILPAAGPMLMPPVLPTVPVSFPGGLGVRMRQPVHTMAPWYYSPGSVPPLGGMNGPMLTNIMASQLRNQYPSGSVSSTACSPTVPSRGTKLNSRNKSGKTTKVSTSKSVGKPSLTADRMSFFGGKQSVHTSPGQLFHFKRRPVVRLQVLTVKACEICGSVFRELDALCHHLYLTHNVKATKQSLSGPEAGKPMPCFCCGQGFFSPSGLSRHMRIVHDVQPSTFTCFRCKESGITNVLDHLSSQHAITVRSMVEWRICSLCKLDFSGTAEVEGHMLTAHGDLFPSRAVFRNAIRSSIPPRNGTIAASSRPSATVCSNSSAALNRSIQSRPEKRPSSTVNVEVIEVDKTSDVISSKGPVPPSMALTSSVQEEWCDLTDDEPPTKRRRTSASAVDKATRMQKEPVCDLTDNDADIQSTASSGVPSGEPASKRRRTSTGAVDMPALGRKRPTLSKSLSVVGDRSSVKEQCTSTASTVPASIPNDDVTVAPLQEPAKKDSLNTPLRKPIVAVCVTPLSSDVDGLTLQSGKSQPGRHNGTSSAIKATASANTTSRFWCTLCSKQLGSRFALRRHCKLVHSADMLQCTLCSHVVPRGVAMTQHIHDKHLVRCSVNIQRVNITAAQPNAKQSRSTLTACQSTVHPACDATVPKCSVSLNRLNGGGSN